MLLFSSFILDLQSTPLGVYSNHIPLSQISVPYQSSPRVLIRPYPLSLKSQTIIWYMYSYSKYPVVINLGMDHIVTGVFIIPTPYASFRTALISISFSNDGITWTTVDDPNGKTKVIIYVNNTFNRTQNRNY